MATPASGPTPSFLGIGATIASKWLQVPSYQRSYAWEEEHVRALYEDLSDAFKENESQYFLGSIITTMLNDGTLEVIDGQQRLATTTVLIAAIRDYIHKGGDHERADALRNKYLMTKDEYTMSVKPRVRLNHEDADFFISHVLNNPGEPSRRTVRPGRSSHKRIAKAAEIAAEHVNRYAKLFRETDSPKHLMSLIRYVAENACVICFTVPDHANAYTLFETLNDRGLELTQADLVKNFLFGAVAKTMLEPAQHNWAEMIGALEVVGGRDITATFIRHHWVARNGQSKDRALFKRIKRAINNELVAAEYSRNLCDCAPVYAAILNSSHGFWATFGEGTRQYIDALTTLGVERLRPLLLAVLLEFPPDEAKRVVRLMVSWAVRLLIAGPPAGSVEEQINTAAKSVSDKTVTTAAELLTTGFGRLIPTDAEFQSKFEVATVSKSPLIGYYLRAIEQSHDDQEGEPAKVVNLRSDVVNIEHIIPRNPGPEWTLGREIMDAYCNRIGNMTLMRTRPNALIGNQGFERKKAVYALERSMQMTARLAEYAEWGPEQVESRQADWAARAVKIWPIR